MGMTDETTVDVDSLETVEFTTAKKTTKPTKNTKITVQLGDEKISAPRPKDGVLFFAQSAVSDHANDADRWSSAWNLLSAVLNAQDRHRFLQRACDRHDPLNSAMMWSMIGQLLDRWNLDSKVPPSVPVVVEVQPHPPFPDPVKIFNEDLDLDLVAYPPKDIILGLTASALSTGATMSDQAWVIGLFLDAALMRGDVLSINYRLRDSDDGLDLEHLTDLVRTLISRWYDKPVGNRKSRRAQNARSRKTSRTKAIAGELEPLAGQETLDSALED